MKKTLIWLNMILLLIALVATSTYYSIAFIGRTAGVSLLRWVTIGLVLVLALIMGVFAMKRKGMAKTSGLLSSLAIVFMALPVGLSGIPSVWSISSLVLASGLFCVSYVGSSKIRWIDVVYSLCVALVMTTLVLFAGIWGFKNFWFKLLIILELTVFSFMVGKALSNLTIRRNGKRSVEFACAVLTFIANFTYLLYAFSNVSHIVHVVFLGVLIAAVVLAVISQLLGEKEDELIVTTETTRETFKRNKWGIVATFLILLFVAYSTAVSFSAFNIATGKVYKDQFLAIVGEDFSLPIIEIDTENGEFPTSKKDYVNASFSIFNCEDDEHNFSVEMANNYGDDGSVGIRLRGNSTMDAKKKPFRIKFDEKQSLLGLKKAKSWVLLADYFDQSYARNYTAFSIARNFDNLDFTPTPHHVALILNGSFQGLYLLCEQVDENKGRTNVEEDFDVGQDTEFPFLVEMDNLAYKEGTTGVDNFYVDGFYPVEIKYPEADERGATETEDKVFDYIYEYINAVFTTLRTGGTTVVSFRNSPVGFEDLVDIDSVVDYYILTEIMHNPDATYKSIYFHKTKDGKMKFGPIWDYDYSMAVTFDLPYKESYIDSANYVYMAKYSAIFSRLMADEGFYNKVKIRYNTIAHTIVDVANNLKTYKQTISTVAKFDATLWHGKTGAFQFDMQYDYVRLYLLDRYAFLNDAFAGTHADFIARLG